MKKTIMFLTLVSLLFIGGIVLASDVDDAKYLTTIQITNSGGSNLANESVPFTLSTPNMISGLMLGSDATDSAMLTGVGGSDLAFMPGYDANPWMVWVNDIAAGANLYEYLYTKGATAGKIRYFPDSTGMTIDDDPSMEISDNGTMEWSGYFDADTAGDIINKNGAFNLYGDGSGNLTAVVGIPKLYLDFTRTSSDWVSIPDSATMDFTDGAGVDQPGTIIAWVKAEDATSGTIMSHVNAAANQYNWVFQTAGTDKLLFALYNINASEYIQKVSNVALTAYQGQWIQIAVTYSGSETHAGINLYLNGQPFAGTGATSGAYVGTINAAAVYAMGAIREGAAEFWDGGIATVDFYTTELSAAQIAADYIGQPISGTEAWWALDDGAGNPTDSSGNGHDATANTADWAAEEVVGLLANVNLTASDIASDEYIITAQLHSPFFSLGIDAIDETDITPIASNLVMNAPMWQTECDASPFTTIDSNAKSLTVTNAIWTSSGYSFDGTDDHIRGTVIAEMSEASDFSITGWINGNELGTSGAETFLANTIATANRVGLTLNSGQLYAGVYDGGWTTAGGVVTSGWHYFGMSYDSAGPTIVLYIDTTLGGDGYAPSVNSNIGFSLGDTTGDVADYNGLIGEIQIYGSTLSNADLLQNYNATKSKYMAGDIYTYSTLADVPDDDNSDWVICSDATPYMEYYKHYVDGILVSDISWEYGATFTDASENGNDATPTFRTTASDSNLSASISTQVGLVTGDTPSSTAGGGWTMIGAVPDEPSGMFTEGDDSWGIAGFNIGELWTGAAEGAGQDPTAWHIILVFGLAMIVFVGVYGMTHKRRMGIRGSLTIASLAAMGVLIFFYTQGTIPGLVLIPVGLIVVLLIVWRKSAVPID